MKPNPQTTFANFFNTEILIKAGSNHSKSNIFVLLIIWFESSGCGQKTNNSLDPPHVELSSDNVRVRAYIQTYKAESCCPHSLLGRGPQACLDGSDQIAFVGPAPGPRCFSWYQRVLSVCVSRDEKRYEHSSVECDQQGPQCTLRTTPCCVRRQGSQAALTRQPDTGA